LAAQNIHHASANGLKGQQQLGFSNNKQRKFIDVQRAQRLKSDELGAISSTLA